MLVTSCEGTVVSPIIYMVLAPSQVVGCLGFQPINTTTIHKSITTLRVWSFFHPATVCFTKTHVILQKRVHVRDVRCFQILLIFLCSWIGGKHNPRKKHLKIKMELQKRRFGR